ncbi:Chromosome replication initiation/membrane attachment protein [Mycoplasma yeatsii 13926]|uniref:Chromosome replication initiation/membrane attachment protein n=1 Tax=Mycoplasma yeatsii 13926 TaxID=1188240 RepID=S6G6S9_9MOLU|nr:DnaD domain protein [Mycoplasma yeatsii]EOA07053.1 Chromosome replication initiation/membrane attachment protein [Mycoplasma yeatsii 13926]
MEVLKKGFKYSVDTPPILDAEEYKTLTCLYQPLIGAKTVSLFLTLIQENIITSKLKNQGLDEERLCSITQMTHKEIVDALDILNALNLVRVYVKKDQSKLVKFQIISPLKSKDFFNNDYLNNLLEKTLDEQNYEITKFMLKGVNKINQDEFEEVHIDFADIIDYSFMNDSKKYKTSLKVNSSNCEKLKEVLDLNYIDTKLKEQNITIDLCSENLAKILVDVLIIKKLTENEVILLINNSYDFDKKSIDLILLERELISLVTSEKQKNKTNTKKTQNQQNMIQIIDNMHWNDYCKAKYNIDLSDWAHAIDNIKNTYKFNDGIINCLIDFSYKKNNGSIVVKYIQKIAKTLYEKNIKSTEKTMTYLKKIKNSSAHVGKTIQTNDLLESNLANDFLNEQLSQNTTIFEELEALL